MMIGVPDEAQGDLALPYGAPSQGQHTERKRHDRGSGKDRHIAPASEDSHLQGVHAVKFRREVGGNLDPTLREGRDAVATTQRQEMEREIDAEINWMPDAGDTMTIILTGVGLGLP